MFFPTNFYLPYFLLKDYDHTLAMIAFLVGITPTATACPAVLSYLKGRVHFAISAVIVTNIFMSIFLPLVIWQISNIQVEISSILGRTLILIFSPLLLGQLIQHYSPKIKKTFLEFKTFGFYAWLLVCFIAVGKASDFIRNSATDLNQIIIIGVLAAFICLLSFNLGRFAGGKDFALEGSQTMGQKNTILTLWMSLTYFNPVIALGPIFYLVFHNLYNSYQLAMLAKRERVSQP